MPTPVSRLLLAAAALILAAACVSPGPFGRRPAPPTDAQLVAILLAANNANMSFARLAQVRGARPAVRDFAQRMLADHGALSRMATDLIARAGFEPQESTLSLDLRDASATTRDALRELSGSAFDSAYVANEIAYHTRLIALLDTVMVPAARNPDLRRLLRGVRPAATAHLAHARHLQAFQD